MLNGEATSIVFLLRPRSWVREVAATPRASHILLAPPNDDVPDCGPDPPVPSIVVMDELGFGALNDLAEQDGWLGGLAVRAPDRLASGHLHGLEDNGLHEQATNRGPVV